MDSRYCEIGNPLSFLNQNALYNDLTHLKFKKEPFKFGSFSYEKKLISLFHFSELFTPSIIELIASSKSSKLAVVSINFILLYFLPFISIFLFS